MRKPRRRRENRFNRKHDRSKYIDSANIIQKRCREFINNRYKSECSNYDDDEFIMLNPVKLIPRVLLLVLDNQAFHVGHLLKWILRSKNPIHPLSREPLDMKIQIECVYRVSYYLYNDNIIRSSNNFYSLRNKHIKLLKKWQKSQLNRL